MRKRQKLAIVATALGISVAGVEANPAQAAQLFNFSYSGSGVEASGTFTTTDLDSASNTYTITGITGERNGQQITGLLPTTSSTGPSIFPLPDAELAYDNLLNNSSPFVSLNGIAFNVALLDYPVNLFYDGSSYQEGTYTSTTGAVYKPVSLSVTQASQTVPEPGQIAGTVLVGGLAFLMKRKQAAAQKLKA